VARYVVDIPDRLFRQVRLLLNDRKYASMTDFIEVALENQLSLEDAPLDSVADGGTPTAGGKVLMHDPSVIRLRVANLPAHARCVGPPTTAQLLYPGETSEEHLYLWGQINRLFPIKLGLRVLWSLSEGSPVTLDQFWATAADTARSIGLAIKERQDAEGIKRTYAAWVGLPIGQQPEKSLSRYQSQFIGYRRRDGVLEGGMFRLKLAGLVDDTGVRLTEAGLRLAQAPNPLIDDGDFSGLPLSDAESAIYAEHVAANVPEERRPLAEVLSIVRRGATQTQQIDEHLTEAHDEWNENVVITMRAGTLGRLWELGMVTKEGGHGSMSFGLTSSGAQFLETVASVTEESATAHNQ
jgi:hypothetical protein